jgi:hypothetical protein
MKTALPENEHLKNAKIISPFYFCFILYSSFFARVRNAIIPVKTHKSHKINLCYIRAQIYNVYH